MKKIYLLLALLAMVFAGSYAQTSTPTCSADITFRDSVAYSPFAHYVKFKAVADPGKIIKKVCWSFGDGTRECKESIPGINQEYLLYAMHKFGPTSTPLFTYKVCVTIYYDGGCVAEKCISLTLQSPNNTGDCGAGLKVESSIANPLVRHFAAIPYHGLQKKPVEICWKFGDGTPDVCKTYATTYTGTYSTEHAYTAAGQYEACVTIKYDGGCVARKCEVISVGTSTPTVTCAVDLRAETASNNPMSVHFSAFPYNSNHKKPVSVCWTFGDGTTPYCQQYANTYTGTFNVNHTYTTPGQYEVCVKIVYEDGCETKKCKLIQVPPPIRPDSCYASITVTNAASSNLIKLFTAQPKHNNNKKPVSICWKFGDGTETLCKTYSATYTGTYSVEHAYTAPGQYEACVIIKYEGGCETKKCILVIIPSPVPPVTCAAGIRIEPVAATPLGRHFVAIPENSAQKKPVLICWTFGDGTTEVCKQYASTYTGTYNVQHTFNHPGSYEVCVKIKYDGGCESRKCVIVNIPNPPPPDTCFVNVQEVASSISTLERKFYLGVTPNKPIEKICWNYGDGSAQHCYAPANPLDQHALTSSHLYPGPGIYRLCVKVWYAGGCVVEKCREVVIRPAGGNVCGGYMTDVVVDPGTVAFKGFSTSGPNDPAVSYNWTFGDGTTANGQEVKHKFAAGGTYQVCLFIRTASGCETKICKRIIIGTNAQPQLVLTPNPVSSNVHAVFHSLKTESVTVRIYNANGLVVRSYVRTAVTGSNTWDFDVSTLPTGVYSVVVHSPNQFATAIFFKQ